MATESSTECAHLDGREPGELYRLEAEVVRTPGAEGWSAQGEYATPIWVMLDPRVALTAPTDYSCGGGGLHRGGFSVDVGMLADYPNVVAHEYWHRINPTLSDNQTLYDKTVGGNGALIDAPNPQDPAAWCPKDAPSFNGAVWTWLNAPPWVYCQLPAGGTTFTTRRRCHAALHGNALRECPAPSLESCYELDVGDLTDLIR